MVPDLSFFTISVFYTYISNFPCPYHGKRWFCRGWSLTMCVCVCVHVYMSYITSGGPGWQMCASTPAFMWLLRSELRSSCLYSKCFMNHLSCPVSKNFCRCRQFNLIRRIPQRRHAPWQHMRLPYPVWGPEMAPILDFSGFLILAHTE